MTKSVLTMLAFALLSYTAEVAPPVNLPGSSSSANVTVAASNFPPLVRPLGYAGLEMLRADGTARSGSVDIFGGPVKQVTDNAAANSAEAHYAPFPLIRSIKIAQVWRNDQH